MTVVTPAACSNWCKLTLDHTAVSENGSYGVVLRGSGDTPSVLPANIFAKCQADGADMCVSLSSDGSNRLPMEIVGFDAATNTCEIWVSVPLSVTNDVDLYVWYGSKSGTLTQPAADATYGSQAVWTAVGNMEAVWHMGTPTELSVADSTANGNDGTNYGVTASAGSFGGAGQFNGTSWIDIPVVYAVNELITLSAWCSLTGGSYPNILGAGYWDMQLRYFGDTRRPQANGYSSGYFDATSPDAVDDTMHLLHAVWDGSYLRIYVDGVQKAATVMASAGPVSGWSYNIGREHQRADYYLSGLIDDPRISTTARSANYIATDFAIQSSTSFITVGTPASNGGNRRRRLLLCA